MLNFLRKLSAYFYYVFAVLLASYTNNHQVQHCFADNMVDWKLYVIVIVIVYILYRTFTKLLHWSFPVTQKVLHSRFS